MVRSDNPSALIQKLRVARYHAADTERVVHELEDGLKRAKTGLSDLKARIRAMKPPPEISSPTSDTQ